MAIATNGRFASILVILAWPLQSSADKSTLRRKAVSLRTQGLEGESLNFIHHVNVSFESGGQSAFVQFESNGKLHKYKLHAFSVYRPGAGAVKHTDKGVRLDSVFTFNELFN
jgi:hypothetical protein